MLFRPDLIGEECEGIHEVLTYSIQKSDMDLRRTLFSNIVLSGGSTLFKGRKFLLFSEFNVFGSLLINRIVKLIEREKNKFMTFSEQMKMF